MKRYLVPVLAGVVVFGGVTAFAATLNVSSTTLGSGDATVASCNTAAAVTYTTAFVVANATATTPVVGGYRVATAPITTAAGCATKDFKVTLTGASGVLSEQTGKLDTTGAAAPSFTTADVMASAVTGVSVVISG